MITFDPSTEPSTPKRPSRKEIETLCLLHAAQLAGGDSGRILDILGFSHSHTHLLPELYNALHLAGHVTIENGAVAPTSGGLDWLRDRLSAWAH